MRDSIALSGLDIASSLSLRSIVHPNAAPCVTMLVIGYVASLVRSSALQTEFWTIHDGLCLAWQLGFKFVQVQSDCLHAISAIKDPAASSSSHPLVVAISRLHQRHWNLDFIWIHREANSPVDALAKKAPPTVFDMLQLTSVLAYIQPLLRRDVEGPPYCKIRHV
ncbi:hypothetical protein F3Y22_tig00110187pilonHSYRG00345 [Hibiscus syriacus]|uniref:RNase H type-1 domain-containing protein n=1 Tax=Hibiscus syriacus TaxID=106335 RepID=A0A6A3BGH6_HIBSY|nr:hypothetical protein F3Y22_tig00110187pilonHSYRG00345 [Hibiscus syriacus]